jgi:hypothetical protein
MAACQRVNISRDGEQPDLWAAPEDCRLLAPGLCAPDGGPMLGASDVATPFGLGFVSPARFAGARAAKGKALVKAGRLHSWRVNPIRLEPREKPRAERNDGASVVIKLFHPRTTDLAYAKVVAGVAQGLSSVTHGGVARVLQVLAASPSIETLDITGGAPEMNSAFKPLVIGATKLGVEVIDRCNLTVMVEPSMQWLGPFLKEHKVRIVGEPPRARSCACAALAALPTALFGRTAPSNPRPSPRYAPRSHGGLEPSADARCGAPSRAQPRYRATRSATSTRSVAARSSNARSKASSA